MQNPANEIRLFHQIKASNKHDNITILGIKYSM